MEEIITLSDKVLNPNDHLALGDITVDYKMNPSIIWVRLKRSKTDPFCWGMDVFVGRTRNALCPVSAMLVFLAVRGGTQEHCFSSRMAGCSLGTVLWVRVREALSKPGVDARNYTRHSFRSGAVTTAAHRGIPDATIKLLGQWQSCAYLLYVQTTRNELAALSETLAHI